MKYIKIVFALFVITLLFPASADSQCTSDVLPSDDPSGRIRTIRIINIRYSCNDLWTWWMKGFNEKFYQEDIITKELNYYINYFKEFVKLDSLDRSLKKVKNENYILKGLYEVLLLKKDTLLNVLDKNIDKWNSSYKKKQIAHILRYYDINNIIVKKLIYMLAEDPCSYVRLEAARTLSYLGEKEKSFKLLKNLWHANERDIVLNNFEYFTVSLRNINNERSIKLLLKLAENNNPFCALDASICLLELGHFKRSKLQLISLAKNGESFLIYGNALLYLERFYPDIDFQDIDFKQVDNQQPISKHQIIECILTKIK